MRTIVSPKPMIEKLWKKQEVCDRLPLRIMDYVLKVEYDGEVLLYNTVTGQLIALDEGEIKELEKKRIIYSPILESLVNCHYLVSEDYDEHQMVLNLRLVLQKMNTVAKTKAITHYTILPTTACNARCYYCFERGTVPQTMSEQTANDVVEFIKTHCGGNKVQIRWFGGEPTIATHRIDQICAGLKEAGIQFSSRITSNGYLLNKNLVPRAKRDWNLEFAMISVDGTEQRYNQVKAYVGAVDNPYRTVLQNIGVLLDNDVKVKLRMNFDKQNYQEFAGLVSDIYALYQGNPSLQVFAHQINDDYSGAVGQEAHGSEEWYGDKIHELNELSRRKGLLNRQDVFPCLEYHVCEAASPDAVTITPEGKLVSCPEKFGKDQEKGDLKHGITNVAIDESWKVVGDFERCRKCVFFPNCVKVVNCNGSERCYYKHEKTERPIRSIKTVVDASSISDK